MRSRYQSRYQPRSVSRYTVGGPIGLGQGVVGIAALGADLALWFDANQAYKSSGGGVVTPASILTVVRATAGWYFDSTGTLQQAGNNTLRLDFDPLTLAPLGVLVEEQRTNLLLNTATLSTQSATVTAAAHTLSFYGTGTITLTGVSTAGPLVGTGANSRVTLTFTPTAGSLTLTVSGDVRMANLELGSFATSPIICVGSQVTRNADQISIATSAFPYSTTECTIVATAHAPNKSANYDVAGGAAGMAALLFQSGNMQSARRSDVALVTETGASQAPNMQTTAAACKSGDSALSTNGAVPTTSSVTTAAAFNTGTWPIGRNSAGGANYLNGHIKRLAYYATRKSNAELQVLSA